MTPGTRLQTSAPRPLFRVEGVRDFDVAADGSRFLVITPTDRDQESHVHVIVNWTAALKGEK